MIALIIAGCVTADEYTRHLRAQFVGQPIDSVISMYGPPTASGNFGDGKAHEWVRQMGYRNISSDSGHYAAPQVERVCSWRVITDKNGVITQAGWQGNACYNQLQPLPKAVR